MTFTDEEIIDCRQRGWSVKDIIEEGAAEKRVYQVLRAAGLCRDQRPEHEYVVTVMLPEHVRIAAQSPAIAKRMVSEMFGENVRVTNVEEA